MGRLFFNHWNNGFFPPLVIVPTRFNEAPGHSSIVATTLQLVIEVATVVIISGIVSTLKKKGADIGDLQVFVSITSTV